MFIKKPVLIICSVLLVIATALGTVMLVNPFGALNFWEFMKFNTGVSVIEKYFYEDVTSKQLLDGALLGISASVEDPYTVYMNEEEAESFLESIESDDYTGVGLYISESEENDGVIIVSPLADSPGEKAGLAPGDKILKVNGQSVAGLNIDRVASDMKGPEGTEVVLTVLKKASGETLDVKLTRATIKRETVASEMLDGNCGYIQISQFGINTYEEFVKHFNKLAEGGMEYVVIDLRNNPGGYMDMAVQIADIFVDSGEIVYTMDKYGRRNDYMASEGKVRAPMVILTNGGTASASEVLLGALRDHGIAKSVGERTFGKGVTQIPYKFWDGSILKVTDSRYYTPNDICIDHEGIAPDFEVKMTEDDYAGITVGDIDSDKQLKKAIEILKEK